MNHFLINGVERSCPISESGAFGDLMNYVQRSLNNDASLISIVRVNGHDVTENEENALSATPLSAIDQIEVLTVHPKELADETLQTLLPFTTHLEGLSRQAAERLTAPGGQQSSPLTRLIDGLMTFSEAITSVKDIFGIGKTSPQEPISHAVEMRLLERLRELLDCQQTGNVLRMRDLLAEELPAVLASWRETGIPALMRSRDS